MNTFNLDLLTVVGVLAGIGALRFLMSALDPTNDGRRSPSHKGTRDRTGLTARAAAGKQPARRA